MEFRRFGRTEHRSSVLVFGAAALGEVDQETADAAIRFALEAGINHIDVARDYGDAEIRLAPWLSQIRDDVFLATKTLSRDAEGAWREINESLERLQVDHVDLIQAHAVCDLEDLDTVLAGGGAIEGLERARREGLVSYVGITGHSARAPSVHAEALRRYDFDSVLTPLNTRLYADPTYAADYDELVALCLARDVGLRTIKMISRRNWGDGEKSYHTWYKPFDEQRYVTAATAWLLNGHPEIAGLATAGDASLLALMVRAVEDGASMSAGEAAEVLGEVEDYASPFLHMPF